MRHVLAPVWLVLAAVATLAPQSSCGCAGAARP